MLTRTKRVTLTFRHPFSLKGVDRRLAAGEYEVAAWHEKYGEQVQKIKVGDGEAKTIDFKFSKPAE